MQIDRSDSGARTARERILAELDAQAQAAGHPFAPETLTLEARDGDTWLGGLHAKVGTDWIFVELLAVAEGARGKGVGRRLLAAVEDEARRRGMTGIWLDTYSFQAPGFYRRLGYAEFGRIDDYPPGEARHFFAKRLTPG